MKLFVLGVLVYMGYRLIVPRKEIHIDDNRQQHLRDDEYTDYEEIED